MRKSCPNELVIMILGEDDDITNDFMSRNPYSGPFFSIPRGHYPPFLRFPRHIVDFQAAERKRIADEEAALATRREQARALSAQTAMVKAEEDALMTENKLRAAVEARAISTISATMSSVMTSIGKNDTSSSRA